MKQEDANTKKNTWPAAEEYVQELRNSGASEEYIKKELAALETERASESAPEDEGDDIEVIRGPNA